ncbi:unnamed protein product [Prunus armeniaca]|uniref:Pentatricopeptide repeat-containing protein n=1 Tax=Prunus armeniaca TaxID=36596 RepID=A0A6J5UQC3_PRUAR|nr:unnamed protein product [Prunus armeniaca]
MPILKSNAHHPPLYLHVHPQSQTFTFRSKASLRPSPFSLPHPLSLTPQTQAHQLEHNPQISSSKPTSLPIRNMQIHVPAEADPIPNDPHGANLRWNPNVFSWNVVIRGYSESENPREAVVLYKKMLRNGGSRPDNYTYPLLLKVCANLTLNLWGREVLGHVMRLGLYLDMFVHNAVIHMFVSCRELEAARKVFDEGCVRDLVSWNSLINGYVRSGLACEALRIYQEMELEGFKPDEVTMIGVVSSCAQLENLRLGRKFHRVGILRPLKHYLTT